MQTKSACEPRGLDLFRLYLDEVGRQMPRKEGVSVTLPMKSVYRMVHQADRPDGAVEWGCPRCGRYTVCHPRGRVVVLTGEADSVHVLGAGFPPAPDDVHIASEFDQQWLRTHEMVW